MKSFLLPIGQSAGESLPALLSALSCGAALPVSGLDILHITDNEPDPVIPRLIADLNRVHTLLGAPDNDALFPSSFVFDSFRPVMPSHQVLSGDPASSALLGALRGKGVPLSYKTDRDAVEWAFSVLLSDQESEGFAPFRAWTGRITDCLSSAEPFRIAVLCDPGDPFSAGAAFSVLRFLRDTAGVDPAAVALFCLYPGAEENSELHRDTFTSVMQDLGAQDLVGRPHHPGTACADAVWLLSMPSPMIRSRESLSLLYVILARQLSGFFFQDKDPAPGLHTVSFPGVLTLQSFGDQAESFAAFLHSAAWLLSDLFPALSVYCERSAPLRTLTSNTRNGLFRRLFHGEAASEQQREDLNILRRAFTAVFSEMLGVIRSLPDQLRMAGLSDPLWKQIEDACGRTVTVASEYDVSMAEAEEGGIVGIKPVHRVSMADTVEEQAERRLTDIELQLKNEAETRSRLFKSAGGCWTVPALRQCRERCDAALSRARDQLTRQAQEPGADHYSVAALARRIRLLEAAVARCDRDLADKELTAPVPGELSGFSGKLAPFSSQLLNEEAARKFSALLAASGASLEAARKEALSALPSLLYGFNLSESKVLFKQLLSVCKPDKSSDPYTGLLLSVLKVSRAEIRPLRFLSAGEVPPIPLLPDLYPSGAVLTVSSLLSLLPATQADTAALISEKRGLLAMLLLRQYRRRASDEAALSISRLSEGDSPVLHAWLSARHSGSVRIVSLSHEEISLPFALIIPGRDFIPAKLSPFHAALVPAFAQPWFDRDALAFRDPCTLMSEGDRTILLSLLSSLSEAAETEELAPLRTFLKEFRGDLLTVEKVPALPDDLSLRLKAAYGLRMLPAFFDTLLRKECAYEHSLASDEIAASLTGRRSFPAFSGSVPDDIVFYYRDVPFARENSRTLMDAVPLPAERWTLNLLAQESRTLARASDDYHDALVGELGLLLARYPEATEEARQCASTLLEQASRPVTDTETELVWPWDPKSPSVLTIMSESLGNSLSAAALQPFSDQLALFPARSREIIGDVIMSSMCILPPAKVPKVSENEPLVITDAPETLPDAQTAQPDDASVPEEVPSETQDAPAIQPDAVLPPLSPAFCEALCRLPEGRTLIRNGLLSFERKENNAVRVILTLEGSFTVRLVRDYSDEEIVRLYSHDIPTLAVWPDLPFEPDDWRAYFIYGGLPSSLRFSACCRDGSTVSSPEEETRAVCRTESFPLSFSFWRENVSIGSLPNLLPTPEIRTADPYTACIDFGSVGTSVVFSVGHRRLPLQGPTLVRTLLNNPVMSQDLLRKEFLPAVPVSALLPTASRIFRNVPGADPRPFEDGIVLMSSDLRDTLSIPSDALYTCLKWEEEKGRSVSLCLHQIMLMAALQARYDGASSLAWRFAVPDEMAKTGRERLTALFTSLAEQVNRESGYGIPEKVPLVTFAAESSALGAYFRFCASEDTRGGFMVLDIGACTADISLFLRGREQAVRTCQIPLGVHYMLLPSLLRDPEMLRRDLGFIQDPSFQQDLALLERMIKNAKADPSALRHTRMALDSFLADRYAPLAPALMQNPSTGMPTKLGSVMLLHFSFLMMLSGLVLLQIAADPGKNDFLPEQMSLCISGRGSCLPEYLPDHYKTALWHFLTMFRNRRVASLSMLFSSEKKLEIPVGLSFLQSVSTDLPPASAVPAAISVRPEELLPEFVLRFAREFPASAQLLFNGFFTDDFYHPLSGYGESVVTAAITQSFSEQTAHRPFDALSAWIGSLLDLTDSAAH